jgi:hypothetical protein
MVRNTIGGSKHKSLARKNLNNYSHHDPTPNIDLHQYIAFVHKHFGNGICQVSLINSPYSHFLHCHIRGKFSGKNKKHNLVIPNSFVIVSLRPWESSPINCDLFCLRGLCPPHAPHITYFFFKNNFVYIIIL